MTFPPSRRRSLQSTIPVVLFLLVILMLGGVMMRGLPATEDRTRLPGTKLAGQQLPLLDLESYGDHGADARLTSAVLLAERRPVLLNIFASWCAGCKQEHALLQTLAEERQWPIYGIAWKDAPDDLAAYLERYGNPYRRIGLDPHGNAMMQLGATGTPETYVIGSDGKILYAHRGVLTEEAVRTHLAPWMPPQENP